MTGETKGLTRKNRGCSYGQGFSGPVMYYRYKDKIVIETLFDTQSRQKTIIFDNVDCDWPIGFGVISCQIVPLNKPL